MNDNDVNELLKHSKATRHAHKLFILGGFISLAYVGALGAYAGHELTAMLRMTPEQFATFLSGVFAPLAFLWLVLGFLQQGDELQNSARALWLQGEELKNSVEQQRQLVEVSREQLTEERKQRLRAEEEAENAAQPRLVMGDIGGSYSGPMRTLKFRVTSGGPPCTHVNLLLDGEVTSRAMLLDIGQAIETHRSYGRPEEVEEVVVRVEYTDLRGNRRAQNFLVPVVEDGGPNGDRTLGTPFLSNVVERLSPVPVTVAEGYLGVERGRED